MGDEPETLAAWSQQSAAGSVQGEGGICPAWGSAASSCLLEAPPAATAGEESRERDLKRGGCLSCLMWVMNVIVQLAANRGAARLSRKGCEGDNPKRIERIR